MSITAEVLTAARAMADAIVGAAREAGPDGIPSGHVYAAVNGQLGVGLDTYNAVLDVMVEVGRITVRNHVIRSVVS